MIELTDEEHQKKARESVAYLLRAYQERVEYLEQGMKDIRAEIDKVAKDIKEVFWERDKLYYAIVMVDAIALDALKDKEIP